MVLNPYKYALKNERTKQPATAFLFRINQHGIV